MSFDREMDGAFNRRLRSPGGHGTGCARCNMGDYGRSKRPDGIKHRATQPKPDIEELVDMSVEGEVEATDGCRVDPDGYCEHGHASWLLVEGI